MKTKGVFIMLIIVVSLFPALMFYKYLEKKMQPRESLQKFLFFMLIIFVFISVYTFLLVFAIRLIFPGA